MHQGSELRHITTRQCPASMDYREYHTWSLTPASFEAAETFHDKKTKNNKTWKSVKRDDTNRPSSLYLHDEVSMILIPPAACARAYVTSSSSFNTGGAKLRVEEAVKTPIIYEDIRERNNPRLFFHVPVWRKLIHEQTRCRVGSHIRWSAPPRGLGITPFLWNTSIPRATNPDLAAAAVTTAAAGAVSTTTL